MDFNNNSFNPNVNPYFTPISLDSNDSNQAMYNMNQPYKLDWICPTQYDPYPQFYDQKFQNNFHSSLNQWRFAPPS